MILEKETFKKFGYCPQNLKTHSGKIIIAECDQCRKKREVCKNNYRALCLSCANKTEEKREKLKQAHTGKVLSQKTKEKISQTHTINKIGVGENNSFYGKYHTEETKKKMCENHYDNSGYKNPNFGKVRTQEYCKHMSDAKKGKCMGENNPNWKGGISFEPYCIKFNDEFKERVREFFDRRCYLCEKNEIENGAKLDVHHVTYNKDTCCDNTKPLFVPLCHSCHSKTLSNRNFWEIFFTISLEYLTNGQCYTLKNK